jgi:hypothetical protein
MFTLFSVLYATPIRWPLSIVEVSGYACLLLRQYWETHATVAEFCFYEMEAVVRAPQAETVADQHVLSWIRLLGGRQCMSF